MSTEAQTEGRPADVLVTLAMIAAVASVILTGAAFWLSYEHLHDVAAGHGLAHSGVRAWAWPATVDLFIIIGEVLILSASLRRSVDLWAIGLLVAGSGGSIALNVAGVGANADPMNYIVAAVPPIAALLAFGALMRQLHGALAARLEAAPAAVESAAPEAPRSVEDVTPQSALADALPPAPKAPPVVTSERPETLQQGAPGAPQKAPREAKPERPQSAPKAKTKAPRKAPSKRPQSVTRADAKAAIEALFESKQGRPLESEMTSALETLPGYSHTSRQHANTLRKEIERERPDLAALGSDNVYAMTGS